MNQWQDLDLLERTVLERAAVVALADYLGTPWPNRMRAIPVDDVHPNEILNMPVLVLGQTSGPFLARVSDKPKHGKVEIITAGANRGWVHTSSVWALRIT